MNRVRVAGCGLIALMLTGCSGGRFSFGDQTVMPTELESMAGRWILTAPRAPSCGMEFSAAPGASQGTVAPEGGCPENFFMSRRWAFDQGKLLIKDEENMLLAQFNFGGDRFAGQSTAGTTLTLIRQLPTAN
jgi:hypothetical protein